MIRRQQVRRSVRMSATRALSLWLRTAIAAVAPLGLVVVPSTASADVVAPTVTVPASVTVVGSSDATVRVAIRDGDRAFSLCDWLTCDAEVGVQVYDPSGAQVGIDVVSNSVEHRYLDADLVVAVSLSPALYSLPSGTYSVKVTTIAGDTYVGADPATVTTSTATFALEHVSAAKLSLGRTISKYGSHGWRIVGLLKKDGRLWSAAKVTIQVKIPPLGWSDIATKTTSRKGQVTFTSTPQPGSGKWPARLRATGPHGETVVSKTFALYRR